jgi:hypothetical protein
MFTIIVVDLPATYGVVLGREWCFPLGGYIMNDGSCMMLPNKDGGLTKVLCEKGIPFILRRNKLRQWRITLILVMVIMPF